MGETVQYTVSLQVNNKFVFTVEHVDVAVVVMLIANKKQELSFTFL